MFLSLGHMFATWAHQNAQSVTERAAYSSIATVLSGTMTVNNGFIFVQNLATARNDIAMATSAVAGSAKKQTSRAA